MYKVPRVLCVAVAGTTIPGTVGRLTATGTIPTIGTTTSVSVSWWCRCRRSLLPCPEFHGSRTVKARQWESSSAREGRTAFPLPGPVQCVQDGQTRRGRGCPVAQATATHGRYLLLRLPSSSTVLLFSYPRHFNHALAGLGRNPELDFIHQFPQCQESV